MSVESLLAEVQALRARVRELEQAQVDFLARYEHATRAGRVGVWDWDLRTGELFLDPASKHMLGYTEEEVPDRPGAWQELVHEADRERRREKFQACLNGVTDRYDVEYRVYTKSGEIRWIHTRGRIIRDEDDRPHRFTGTDTDVTERRRAEEEREQLQRQLHQAHKLEAIGTLAGGIAHDFNNILAVIMGNAQLALAKEADGEIVRGNVEEMLQAGVRGRDIVRRILAFSRSGDGHRQTLPIREAVEEAIRFVRPFIPTTIHMQTSLRVEDTLVRTESTQIHQVLLNLCANARDAMPDGGTIRVSLREFSAEDPFVSGHRELSAGQWVLLEVEDDGGGIESEYQDRVFDPFFSTKRSENGTGLGLAMVYGIVQEHGGDVELESTVGEGTTFRIYLPVAEAYDEEADPDPGSEPSDTPRRHGRVLLVDDEEGVLRACRGMLEALDYEVVSFSSAADALHALLKSPDAFDVVITDQTMPELTGLRLATEISAVRPDVPIVLCTGYSESISEDSIREAGVSKVIMKPFLADELSRVLRSLMVAT